MAVFNSSFPTQLLASTLNLIEPKLHDAYASKNQLTAALKKDFTRSLEGEPYINHRVRLAGHTVRSYAGAETIPIMTPNNITVASYPWKQLVGSISLTGIDMAKNSGSEAKVADMWGEEVDTLMTDFAAEVDRESFGDGTGNSGKDLDGLGLILDSDGSFSNVGGIDSNTYPLWRNYYRDAASASFALVGTNYMQTAINTCNRKQISAKVDLILMTQTLFESYMNSATKVIQIQMATPNRMIDLGFDSGSYLGVPIVWSDNQTAGKIDFLTTSSFYWNYISGFNMKPLDIVRPANQDVQSQLVIMYANFSCGNRATNGTIVNFAA